MKPKVEIAILFCITLLACRQGLAQDQTLPGEEFDALITPLELALRTSCGETIAEQDADLAPLSEAQMNLFRRAYVATRISDDIALQSLVTDPRYHRDLYGFFGNLSRLADSPDAIVFLYRQDFDRSLRQLRPIAEQLQGFDADLLVSIVRCGVRAGGASANQGGFVYMSLIDGDWKFHTRQ